MRRASRTEEGLARRVEPGWGRGGCPWMKVAQSKVLAPAKGEEALPVGRDSCRRGSEPRQGVEGPGSHGEGSVARVWKGSRAKSTQC